jgi:cytosine/adenosine deaminase-related metal-dependent hydrolase
VILPILSTTIHHATLVLPDRIERASLHLSGGYITAEPAADAWALNLHDHLIFPGLINAHDHLHLNNIPCLPQEHPFPNSYAWINAFQTYFADPHVAAAVAIAKPLRYMQGGLKNLLAGATTVAHHDPWHATLDESSFPVGLLRDFGWSHSLGLGTDDWGLEIGDSQSPVSSPQSLPRYGPPVVESFAATPARQPWIIHLAEGTDAISAAELSWLDQLGCLAGNTVLVHGAGLTAADIERVIARDAAVIWCPSSNLSMLGHTLDPRRLFDAGRLALGSDSRLSGARDLLDELRVAAAHSDLTPRELLWLVTSAARGILRLPEVGGLDAGQRADLLILRDIGGDPYRQLIDIKRKDVCAVVRGGAPLIAEPGFADWFAACDTEAIPVLLDGQPKLLSHALAQPTVIALEPGLELVRTNSLHNDGR